MVGTGVRNVFYHSSFFCIFDEKPDIGQFRFFKNDVNYKAFLWYGVLYNAAATYTKCAAKHINVIEHSLLKEIYQKFIHCHLTSKIYLINLFEISLKLL